MTKYVVLFRGINVGGNNKVAMKPLVAALEEAGFSDVKHYIQSGNIVLSSSCEPTKKVGDIVEAMCGFRPQIMAITASEFKNIAAKNPYAEQEGKTVHCFICSKTPQLIHEKVEQYQLPSEQYWLGGRVLYLFAPEGIGRSKLAGNMESCLGVAATARNLNTINKLLEMI